MKKQLIFILLSISFLVSCNKRNQCHNECYVVLTEDSGKQDTTKIPSGACQYCICDYWNDMQNGKGTDVAGNAMSSSQYRLVCP